MPFCVHLLVEYPHDGDSVNCPYKENEMSSYCVLEIAVSDIDRATSLISRRQFVAYIADVVRVSISLLHTPIFGSVVPDAVYVRDGGWRENNAAHFTA